MNFKDIHKNGYDIEIINEGNVEYLCITAIVSCKKNELEKLSSSLYYTNISNIETHAIVNKKLTYHN